jgi:hypothetical protein
MARTLYPREIPGTNCIGGSAGSERVQKISPPQGFDPRTVLPAASHYTDWAITVQPTCVYRKLRTYTTYLTLPSHRCIFHAVQPLTTTFSLSPALPVHPQSVSMSWVASRGNARCAVQFLHAFTDEANQSIRFTHGVTFFFRRCISTPSRVFDRQAWIFLIASHDVYVNISKLCELPI